MTRRIFVSSAQKSAAEAMVKRSAVTGRQVSSSVRRIADARVEPATNDPAESGTRTSTSA